MVKILLLFILSFSLQAKEVPPLTGPIIDRANLITDKKQMALSRGLKKYKKQTGNQLQILTINSLDDETLEGYSIKVVDKWQLGDKEKDNGILLLVALKERKMRIEVGQGLEGDLPDALAGRIISQVVPYFKKANYEQGIILGTSLIIKILGGDHKALKTRERRSEFTSYLPIVFIMLWFWLSFFRPVWLIPILGGASYGRRGGGFSGGGGWSGGGGGFSGGGASGSW
ncbi:MAG: hypothetical protein DRQ88_11115 [Epsilonproteobacteria bacterium]|nr:MAG: hypothetical protein DRQ89_05985 [Campylobacterota bacterium]RLA64295.1 MAG: hypothetical protein DRQ88_11115 [Campylobacterota bacterium]